MPTIPAKVLPVIGLNRVAIFVLVIGSASVEVWLTANANVLIIGVINIWYGR
jgi:hypothetical protein